VPDATQQPAALQNGEVDVITPQPNVDLVEQIKAIEGVNVQFEAGTVFEHYDLNLKNEHLKSLKVRQAVAACIDREEIVTTLYRSVDPEAQVLNNRIFMPNSPSYKDGSGQFAKQDIALAKSLLEEDGYVLGDDGFYAKGGKKLSLRLGRRDPNPRRQQTNELAAAACKEAGIELTDDPAEDFNAVRLPAGDYDIALFAWVASCAREQQLHLPAGRTGRRSELERLRQREDRRAVRCRGLRTRRGKARGHLQPDGPDHLGRHGDDPADPVDRALRKCRNRFGCRPEQLRRCHVERGDLDQVTSR